MGILQYWWAVLHLAWREAWRVVIRHTFRTLLRDAIIFVVAVVLFYWLQARLVEGGLTSGDNLQDTVAWVAIAALALVTLFAGLFVVEALFVVPYRLWKEAKTVPDSIQKTYRPSRKWTPFGIWNRLKHPTSLAAIVEGRNVIGFIGRAVNARGDEGWLRDDIDFGRMSRTRVFRVEGEYRVCSLFSVKPLRVYILPWTEQSPVFGQIDDNDPSEIPPLRKGETFKVVIKIERPSRPESDPYFEWGMKINEFMTNFATFSLVVEFQEGRLGYEYGPEYVSGVLSNIAASHYGATYDAQFPSKPLKQPRYPI